MKLFAQLLLAIIFFHTPAFADTEYEEPENSGHVARQASAARIVEAEKGDEEPSRELAADNEHDDSEEPLTANMNFNKVGDISNGAAFVLKLDRYPNGSPKVSKKIVGANFLYWVQDPSDRDLSGFFKSAKIGSLRFPGGTVADNYDWETNSLIDPDSFPGESKGDPEKRTNFLQFLKYARHTVPSAEPHFVVNVEAAFSAKDNFKLHPERVRKLAKHAADWVKAVKNAGFHVSHWEIGNELYFHPKVGASDYAKVLKIYSEEMKIADPTIKIGAVGPSGLNLSGLKDRLTPSGLSKMSKLTKKEIKQLFEEAGGKTDGIRALNDNQVVTNPDKWWQVVGREAANDFDFFILHEYNTDRLRGDFSDKLTTFNEITTIKLFLNSLSREKKEAAITEWNACEDCVSSLSEAKSVLTLAEIFIALLRARVEIANFWPVSFTDRQSLLGSDSKVRAAGEVFKELSSGLQAREIKSELIQGEDKLVDYFASADADDKFNLIITYRGSEEVFLRVAGANSVSEASQFVTDSDGESSRQIKLHPKEFERGITLTLRPNSITVVSGKLK